MPCSGATAARHGRTTIAASGEGVTDPAPCSTPTTLAAAPGIRPPRVPRGMPCPAGSRVGPTGSTTRTRTPHGRTVGVGSTVFTVRHGRPSGQRPVTGTTLSTSLATSVGTPAAADGVGVVGHAPCATCASSALTGRQNGGSGRQTSSPVAGEVSASTGRTTASSLACTPLATGVAASPSTARLATLRVGLRRLGQTIAGTRLSTDVGRTRVTGSSGPSSPAATSSLTICQALVGVFRAIEASRSLRPPRGP